MAKRESDMTAIERLEEELNRVSWELKQYQEKEEARKDKKAWSWTQHTDRPDDGGLPVPRLELRCVILNGHDYSWVWNYDLIYRHRLGHIIAVPLGKTRCDGGKAPQYAFSDLPFRERVHIYHDMHEMNLPAYACLGDQSIKLEGENYGAQYSAMEAAGKVA